MVLTFAETENNENWFEGEGEFSPQHVGFQMPLRHSSGDAKAVKLEYRFGTQKKDLNWI